MKHLKQKSTMACVFIVIKGPDKILELL